MTRIGAYETEKRMRDAIAILFLEFFAFSVLGWMYEATYSSIIEGRFVNPGFLNGPYCPAYGVGVVAAIVFLSKIKNNFVFALASAVVATVIEFFTSFVLELIYDARWWDYSNHPFNIDGRVCLDAFVFFAIGALICVRLIHPHLEAALERMPDGIRNGLAIACFAIILLDLVVTHEDLIGLRQRLAEIQTLLPEEVRL